MSKQVKNALYDFYIAKKYKGKIFKASIVNNLFLSYRYAYIKIHKSSAYNHSTGACISEAEYSVINTVCMERKEFRKHFPNKHNFTIRGTNLVLVDEDTLSWWKLKKFGNITGIKTLEDIEPEHINNLKYRNDVILYLKFLKESFNVPQRQMTLPGF